MRRTLLICAGLLLLGDCAMAQKANVNKLKNRIEYASTPVSLDFSNVDSDKVEEFRALITPALTHPESENMHLLWKYALRLKVYDMNAMLKARTANNNEFEDANAFFENQYDIVVYAERYQKLITTPNAKGKMPLREEELQKEHALAQQIGVGPRGNLYVAATNVVNTDPARTIKYLDLYYASFQDPLFADAPAREGQEEQIIDSYYIYATALKGMNGDSVLRKEYLEKAADSPSFGKNALYELMEMAKSANDMQTWKSICEKAMQKFPEEGIFGRSLLQQYMTDKQEDKAIALADQLIAKNEAAGTPDEWPHYFKAIACFNQDKMEDAYENFTKAAEINTDFADALSSAGTTAWKIAQSAGSDKAKRDAWYANAIDQFEKCRQLAPDKENLWGYSLYAIYNNTGKTEKAKEFKKYDK